MILMALSSEFALVDVPRVTEWAPEEHRDWREIGRTITEKAAAPVLWSGSIFYCFKRDLRQRFSYRNERGTQTSCGYTLSRDIVYRFRMKAPLPHAVQRCLRDEIPAPADRTRAVRMMIVEGVPTTASHANALITAHDASPNAAAKIPTVFVIFASSTPSFTSPNGFLNTLLNRRP